MKRISKSCLSMIIIICLFISIGFMPRGLGNNTVYANDTNQSNISLNDTEKVVKNLISNTVFTNSVKQEDIIDKISEALGSDFTVIAADYFVFDAAVNGVIVTLNGNELARTRTADGSIEGCVKITKDGESIFVNISVAIPAQIDEDTYSYTTDDLVSTTDITVSANAVTGVAKVGKKLLVIDGKELNASSIKEGAFFGTASLLDPAVETVIIRNISYSKSLFEKASSLKVIVFDEGVTNDKVYDGPFSGKVQRNFNSCTSLEYISFCEGIKYVGYADFGGAAKLKGVVLPASLTKIGGYAFSNCTGMEAVAFPQKVLDGNLFLAQQIFNNCKALISVRLPEGVVKVFDNQYLNCASLKSVVLPSTLKTVGANSFKGCAKLLNIVLPSSVTSLAATAFTGAALENITVTGNSLDTASVNGLITLSGSVKIITWGNTETAKALGNSYTDLANYHNHIDNAILDSNFNSENISVNITMENGAAVPKTGMVFEYKKSDGETQSPAISSNEENTEFTFILKEPISYSIDFKAAKSFTTEEAEQYRLKAQNAVDNYSFARDTKSADIINCIKEAVNENSIQYVWIDSLSRIMPIDNAEIYLEGKLIGSTDAQNGSVFGTIGMIIGEYHEVVSFEKILPYETERYNYTRADLAPDDAFTIDEKGFLKGYVDNYRLVIVPEKITQIDNDSPLRDLTKAQTIIFHENISLLKWSTCARDIGLEVAIINSRISKLYGNNFLDCTSLKYIKLSETITELGQEMFKNAISLNAIKLPSALTSLGNGAFTGSGITDIYLPATLQSDPAKSIPASVYIHSDDEKQNFRLLIKKAESFMESIPKSLDTEDKFTEKVISLVEMETAKISVESFSYKESQIKAKIRLTVTVDGHDFSYVISGEQIVPNYTVDSIAKIISDALNEIKYTNDTVAEDIYNKAVESVDDDRVEICWVQEFDKVRCVNGANIYLSGVLVGSVPAVDGSITAVLGVFYKGETATVIVDKVITASVAKYSFKTKAPESCFTVDEKGVLTAYNGNYELVIVPSTVKTIEVGVFKGNTTLKCAIIPDSVTTIKYSTFVSCSSLEVAVVSDKVSKLTGMNFKDCINLKYIKLPNTLKVIGESNFPGCSSLETITVPDQVTEIDQYAFYNTSLYEITLPASLECVYTNAFGAKTGMSHARMDKFTVLSKDAEYYNGKKSGDTKAVSSTALPLSLYPGSLSVCCYKGSTTEKLFKKTTFEKPKLIYKEYLDQTYLDAVYAAESIVDNIPWDTETSKLLKQFISDKIINSTVSVEITEFSYSYPNITSTVHICKKVDNRVYYVELTGYKKIKFSGLDDMVVAAQQALQTMTVTDDTVKEDITAVVENVIDSGTAKVTWTSDFAKRKSVYGAVVNAPGVSKTIEGVSGRVTGYINIKFKGKNSNIVLDRSIDPEIENLYYSTVSDESEFTILENRIYDYTGNAEVLVIPDKTETIETTALRGKSGIKAIIVCDGITALKTECFSQMPDLEAVYLPDSCTNLGESTTKLDASAGSCFAKSPKLKYVRLSRYTTIIPFYSFSKCDSITEFYFHEGLEMIGQRAFWVTVENMDDLVLPSSLDKITSYVFAGNNAQGTVEFDSISILSKDLKYTYSDEKYPTAGPFTCYSNKEVFIEYPKGAEANYLKDGNLGRFSFKITPVEQKQSLSQAAIDAQRLLNDLAASNETTKEVVEEKINKLLTNSDLKFVWTKSFEREDVTEEHEGRVTGSLLLYDKNNKKLSFSLKLDRVIPLCRYIDNRTITVYDSDAQTKKPTVIGETETVKEQKDDASNWTLIIIVAVCVVFIAAGIVTFVLIYKQKHKTGKM